MNEYDDDAEEDDGDDEAGALGRVDAGRVNDGSFDTDDVDPPENGGGRGGSSNGGGATKSRRDAGRRDSVLDDFKVVYVAPMKALAAEVVATFSKRLASLGMQVRELTGDTQLTKAELAATQMIVTTPEKWDVVTRKSGGDMNIASIVSLLIIDEVHLLNDERGSVIEVLVARTLRQVEVQQSMIRIVGLSATLPNYADVADFLRVDRESGLFVFDARFRPVPLRQQFIGVSEPNFMKKKKTMLEICYEKAVNALKNGKQVMVFVHSRKDTFNTCEQLIELAAKSDDADDMSLFCEHAGVKMTKSSSSSKSKRERSQNKGSDARPGHRDDEDDPANAFADNPRLAAAIRDVAKSRSNEVRQLFEKGFGVHHAGMLRSDRTLTERLFSEGHIKVLCCTATLAWGVNLPAHTVIIKGTEVYDQQRGTFVDLGMLDVAQIFGRAGRPQFDTSGEGIIITSHNKLAHYCGMMTHSTPIESNFIGGMKDNLNAEVVLGTVGNVTEAVAWLGYTYLYVRMRRNPLSYGIDWEALQDDPSLAGHRRTLIVNAARQLDATKMVRFDERSGIFYPTEMGRVASHYYITHSSIEVFNEYLSQHMSEADVFAMLSLSAEFKNVAVREEELPELTTLMRKFCAHSVRAGVENRHGKVNVLLQTYIGRGRPSSFSLCADLNYIAQNAGRIARSVFEIVQRRGWSSLCILMLDIATAIERRLWPHECPFAQLNVSRDSPHRSYAKAMNLSPEMLWKLDSKKLSLSQLKDMDAGEVGAILRHPSAGAKVLRILNAFPDISLDAVIQPITRTVLRVSLTVEMRFDWVNSLHGSALKWLILVEDSDNEFIYHSESLMMTRKMCEDRRHTIAFSIPVFEPLPPQYYVRMVSESWLHAGSLLELSFRELVLPSRHPPHTELLSLNPLPIAALQNQAYESLYRAKFRHFNPVQTQVFHTLYHTDGNVLLGAPTGSGKTIAAEIAIMRVRNTCAPGSKVIYIAPLKALVRERIKDWGRHFCPTLGLRLAELTGDNTPDMRALMYADVIVATPEKWDGISRSWKDRGYVKKVSLMIIDEIHLLGNDRGPILEVIVSRMNYISQHTKRHIRIVGLSTALSNARDLADWMNIGTDSSGAPSAGLFNFKPSVRPVPLEAHIQGYPGRHYCPRMMSMNKPTYAAIVTHSADRPVLVFVSSRRQTRLTAMDLIAYAAADENPGRFLNNGARAGSGAHTGVDRDDDIEALLDRVQDRSLQHTLRFGIGLHHAGLTEADRTIVEKLFLEERIQVLVATSTLAWGVNLPAHLVVIKGTEYYDGDSKTYVDFPITDVLQMMGRAGRPQFDSSGVAVIMVHDVKKSFYKKFLYEPFPVESSLIDQLHDHFNAEIVNGTIASKQDAVRYLTWTFFYRRLLENPAYYGLDDATSADAVDAYLSDLVDATVEDLVEAGTIRLKTKAGGRAAARRRGAVDEDGGGDLEALPLGRVASYYYLKYTTAALFEMSISRSVMKSKSNATGSRSAGIIEKLLKIVTGASEFDDMPVRHNEDVSNAAIIASNKLRFRLDADQAEDPHLKVNLLLQVHCSRLGGGTRGAGSSSSSSSSSASSLRVQNASGTGILPNTDYVTDTKSVLEQTIRIVQAMIDVSASKSYLAITMHGVYILQMLVQGLWMDDNSLLMLPKVHSGHIESTFKRANIRGIRDAIGCGKGKIDGAVGKLKGLTANDKSNIMRALRRFPLVNVSAVVVSKTKDGDGIDDGDDIHIKISIRKRGGGGGGHKSGKRAYAPRFPKMKNEGWFVLVSTESTSSRASNDNDGIVDGDLLCLKRTQFGAATTVTLTSGRSDALRNGTRLRVHVLSDSYIGLDASCDVDLPRHMIPDVDTSATPAAMDGDNCQKDDTDDDDDDLDFWLEDV